MSSGDRLASFSGAALNGGVKKLANKLSLWRNELPVLADFSDGGFNRSLIDPVGDEMGDCLLHGVDGLKIAAGLFDQGPNGLGNLRVKIVKPVPNGCLKSREAPQDEKTMQNNQYTTNKRPLHRSPERDPALNHTSKPPRPLLDRVVVVVVLLVR